VDNKGFTAIPNELIEALGKIRISGEANQILWVIIRKTFGWHKVKDKIALSQFVLSTGIKKPNIIRALHKLIEMKIIKKDNDTVSSYCIQEDFSRWKPLSKKITLSKKIINVIKKDNLALSKKIPTKESIKRNINICPFEKFWKIYPRKEKKEKVEIIWNKLKPTEKLFRTIYHDIERRKKTNEWMKNEGEFIPYPENYLYDCRWKDYIEDIPKADSTDQLLSKKIIKEDIPKADSTDIESSEEIIKREQEERKERQLRREQGERTYQLEKKKIEEQEQRKKQLRLNRNKLKDLSPIDCIEE